MRVEISLGEAIDKFSILEIKMQRINDPQKKEEIQKEIIALYECIFYKAKYTYFYKLLLYFNEMIWVMTDELKKLSYESSEYSKIAHDIFDYNQKRYRIKNFFNLLENCNLKEQKSYTKAICKIVIDNEDTFYCKIPEICYLTTENDVILLDDPWLTKFKEIINIPTVILSTEENSANVKIVDIKPRILVEQLQEIFELQPITYLSGGLFGDFIQQLSVINENFYKTGRKGVLYIANTGDNFRYGLEQTYTDTYDIISSQKYIKTYKKYNGEQFDVHLSAWRQSPLLFKVNWHNLYSNIYNIEWGKHKWLDAPIDKKWENTVLINIPHYRFSHTMDYVKLYSLYDKNLMFISGNIDDYNYFKHITNLDIPFYHATTFNDLCIAINSCKLLVGGLSGILTIGHACHKDRIICLSGLIDDSCNVELDKNLPNIKYTIE